MRQKYLGVVSPLAEMLFAGNVLQSEERTLQDCLLFDLTTAGLSLLGAFWFSSLVNFDLDDLVFAPDEGVIVLGVLHAWWVHSHL